MSNTSNARGKHVSPGIYTKEVDLTYAVKSLGITTLGVAGETLKGPAFMPILVEDWAVYKDYFGGTSAAKFKGSGYPKYELPYIAKSYLEESKQLYVTRVLGLSGYNAGPAWVISAEGDSERANGMVIAVIRSRGKYQKLAKAEGYDECNNPAYTYDKLTYDAVDVTLDNYTSVNMIIHCDTLSLYTIYQIIEISPEIEIKKLDEIPSGSTSIGRFSTFEDVKKYPSLKIGDIVEIKDASKKEEFKVNPNNYGLFTLVVTLSNGDEVRYPVSLNPGTKDYILDTIGMLQDEGEAPIYVEELYDVALEQLINLGEITAINSNIIKFEPTIIKPIGAPVLDIMTNDEASLIRSNVGQRYIADKNASENLKLIYHVYDKKNNLPIVDADGKLETKTVEVGHIYTVRPYNDNGKRKYFYAEYSDPKEQEVVTNGQSGSGDGSTGQVLVLAYDRYFMLTEDSSDIAPVACDLNNYKEQFRSAMTPWFVSELKGDGKDIEVKKLFRFHTISDGNASNSQVKISIENIKPDEGLFDVIIRDYNDNDASVIPLEKYLRCNMQPGTSNYIGLKIGTTNGEYETVSKYVTVEIIENDVTASSVPCGFLGYPVRNFVGLQPNGKGETGLVPPYLAYNEMYDDEIKTRRQYFGMSDITGIDLDILNYKGKDAYGNDLAGYTPGFHLDSTLDEANDDITVKVDGILGYTWRTVSPNNVTVYNVAPRIGSEDDMIETIYADTSLRKFTCYPYGGFDGWDVYRDARTNTDDFKATKYRAPINTSTGTGNNFSRIIDAESLKLTGNTINTDYYAFLAAYRQFSNPEEVDINVFATPGIDYVNNRLLTEDVLEMIEEERMDSVYIPTTPDKPFGASDAEDEMYAAIDVVNNLEDTYIDTSYAATYYPWIKYHDTENNKYIMLPATKDLVRNLAETDNKKFPWYAPAGVERGKVNCTKVHTMTTIDDEDILYEGRINPVKKFASEGVLIWGNKTMYKADTPLNRLNVRRLMLRIRKLIAIACIKLIFDPNDATVKQQFLSLVNPILTNIKSNRGIADFKIVVDDSVEARDRHELPAKIWIKPTPTLEYIDITFVITPLGATFDE